MSEWEGKARQLEKELDSEKENRNFIERKKLRHEKQLEEFIANYYNQDFCTRFKDLGDSYLCSLDGYTKLEGMQFETARQIHHGWKPTDVKDPYPRAKWMQTELQLDYFQAIRSLEPKPIWTESGSIENRVICLCGYKPIDIGKYKDLQEVSTVFRVTVIDYLLEAENPNMTASEMYKTRNLQYSENAKRISKINSTITLHSSCKYGRWHATPSTSEEMIDNLNGFLEYAIKVCINAQKDLLPENFTAKNCLGTKLKNHGISLDHGNWGLLVEDEKRYFFRRPKPKNIIDIVKKYLEELIVAFGKFLERFLFVKLK